MKAITEEFEWDGQTGRRIVIEFPDSNEQYVEQVCRGVNSYLELVEELEYEVEHDANNAEE